MSSGGTIEGIGDNSEFSVATAGTDVTVYFNGGATANKTSANDTATEKYQDNYGTVKYIQLRNDQAVSIVSINGMSFTDPISITKNTGWTEKLDSAIIFKLVVRTTTDNTNIKIRVRGK